MVKVHISQIRVHEILQLVESLVEARDESLVLSGFATKRDGRSFNPYWTPADRLRPLVSGGTGDLGVLGTLGSISVGEATSGDPRTGDCGDRSCVGDLGSPELELEGPAFSAMFSNWAILAATPEVILRFCGPLGGGGMDVSADLKDSSLSCGAPGDGRV